MNQQQWEDSCVVSLFMNVQTLYEQYTLCWQTQVQALISQEKLETVPFALVVTTLAKGTVCSLSHERRNSQNVQMPSIMPKTITGGQLWLLVQSILPVTTTSQLVFNSGCNHNPWLGLGTACPRPAIIRCMHYIQFLCSYRQC